MITSAFNPTALRAETKSSTVVVSPITKRSGAGGCSRERADGHASRTVGDGDLADAHLLPHDDDPVASIDHHPPLAVGGHRERLEAGRGSRRDSPG